MREGSLRERGETREREREEGGKGRKRDAWIMIFFGPGIRNADSEAAEKAAK